MNHSFHYFNDKVTFDRRRNFILDKNKILLLKLCNLCNHEGLYTPSLEKTMIKKKSLVNYKSWFGFREIQSDTSYNYKITINVDFSKMKYLLVNGLDIPQRNLFFKLLKRNFSKREDSLIHKIVEDNNIPKSSYYNGSFTYYSDNILSIDNLYFDIEYDRIYLNSSDIVRNRFVCIPLETFLFYKNVNTLNKFIESQTNSCILTLNEKIYDEKYPRIRSTTKETFDAFKNKTVVVDLSTFQNTLEQSLNFIECKRYEYSLIDYSNKKVIPQLLCYDTLVLDDSIFNSTQKHDIVKSYINNSNVKIISKYYYKYRKSDINKWLNTILGKNYTISTDFIVQLMEYSSFEKVKLNNSKKLKLFHLEQFEKKYLQKCKSDYSFNIDEFFSLPYNFIRREIKQINLLPDESCSICLEEITSDNIGVTSTCNHYYCHTCLVKALKGSNNCPLCRTFTKPHKGILDEMTSYYGKKLKYLMNLIDIEQNIVVTSRYTETIKSLIDLGINTLTYTDLEENEYKNKFDTIVFMESLNNEDDYIQYFVNDKKKIYLDYKHN